MTEPDPYSPQPPTPPAYSPQPPPTYSTQPPPPYSPPPPPAPPPPYPQPIPGYSPGFIGSKDPVLAVILELLPGVCISTFGIGNLYVGNVALGVVLMLSYWFLTVVNFFLCFVCIGFFTWPLTFLAFAIGSTWVAYTKAKETQAAFQRV